MLQCSIHRNFSDHHHHHHHPSWRPFAPTSASSSFFSGKRKHTMSDSEDEAPPHAVVASPRLSPAPHERVRLPPISSLLAQDTDDSLPRLPSLRGVEPHQFDTSRVPSFSALHPEQGLRSTEFESYRLSSGSRRSNPIDHARNSNLDHRDHQHLYASSARGSNSMMASSARSQLSAKASIAEDRNSVNDLREGGSADRLHPWKTHHEAQQLFNTWERLRAFNISKGAPIPDVDPQSVAHAARSGRGSWIQQVIDAELQHLASSEGAAVAYQVAASHDVVSAYPVRHEGRGSSSSLMEHHRFSSRSPEVPYMKAPRDGIEGSDIPIRRIEQPLPSPDPSSFHSYPGRDSWQLSPGRSPPFSFLPSSPANGHPSSPVPPMGPGPHAPLDGPSSFQGGRVRSCSSSFAPHDAPGGKTNAASRRSKARRRVTKREGEVPACLGCGRLSTAEWRRGPTGPRTLCNACGLLFAKMSRLRRAEGSQAVSAAESASSLAGSSRSAQDPTLEELRQAVGTSSKSHLQSHQTLPGRPNLAAGAPLSAHQSNVVGATSSHWPNMSPSTQAILPGTGPLAHFRDQSISPRPGGSDAGNTPSGSSSRRSSLSERDVPLDPRGRFKRYTSDRWEVDDRNAFHDDGDFE
ncbi:unnamed protein product [Sympodiomycopsis kandeliae]